MDIETMCNIMSLNIITSFILVICNGPEKLSALLIPKENLIDAGFSFL